ncbi:MAG TPA: hypothetical protein VFL79_05750 [Terriglobia bacterium]|nr:hypothetical protein [Terriglobia bacterium]
MRKILLDAFALILPLAPAGTMVQAKSGVVRFTAEAIQQDRPITGILSGRLNVEVNEILDAAKESILTGKPVAMPKQ